MHVITMCWHEKCVCMFNWALVHVVPYDALVDADVSRKLDTDRLQAL